MAVEWKVAFPLHPEFRTLPMVWYVPPLSPVQSQIEQGNLPTETDGVIPKAETMRIPLEFLANMFTAGNTDVIKGGLDRMLALRVYMREKNVKGRISEELLTLLEKVGLDEEKVEGMHKYMAIANYEDRFVIPTSHKEMNVDNVHEYQGSLGFTPGNNTPNSSSGVSLFPEPRGMDNNDVRLFIPPAEAKRIPLSEEGETSGSLFPSLDKVNQ